MTSHILTCSFLPDVLCSYLSIDIWGIINRCFKCKHYLRFMEEMQEEEDAFFAEKAFLEEVDRLRKGGHIE